MMSENEKRIKRMVGEEVAYIELENGEKLPGRVISLGAGKYGVTKGNVVEFDPENVKACKPSAKEIQFEDSKPKKKPAKEPEESEDPAE